MPMKNLPGTHWKKFILSCTAGNVLELYEFIIYGYFASVIGTLFFPTHDPYASLAEAFAVFATGSIVRPFSALLFGHIGDRLGRRISLIISISLMAISTLSIGLLPTYSQIGVWAPILLVASRVGQGLSMTGEEVGAAIFLMETAPHNQKGYASSWVLGSVYLGLVLGSLVAALIFSTLDNNELMAWKWRIPFLIGGAIGTVALLVRLRQPESYEFKNAIQNHLILKNPLLELYNNDLFTILKSTLLFSLLGTGVYLFAVYIPNTINTISISKFMSMMLCSYGFIMAFLTSIFVGKLVDKIGSNIPMILSSLGFIFLSYPIFYLLNTHSLTNTLIALSVFSILLGLTAGSVMLAATKSFNINVRFSGSCISFNLAMSIFGSASPLIALYLTKITHDERSPAILLIIVALVSLAAIFLQPAMQKVHYAHKANY